MPRRRLSCPLVNSDTVSGTIGNTQGVSSAASPDRNASSPKRHRPVPAGRVAPITAGVAVALAVFFVATAPAFGVVNSAVTVAAEVAGTAEAAAPETAFFSAASTATALTNGAP